mgnify:CR=1 FL=1
MKAFLFKLDVTSTAWETAEAYVEAETIEEAKKLFNANPYDYDWDNWDTHDSETQGWNIESVEFDQWRTDYLIAEKKKEDEAQTPKQEETK